MRVEDIQKSRVLEHLDEFYTMTPTANALGVGVCVCMAAEILGRSITPENSAQTIQDAKQFTSFQSTVLKIPKSSVPKMVATALDKFIKDKWWWVWGTVDGKNPAPPTMPENHFSAP